MPVRLTCGLCGTLAVNGLLTRTSWGHVELNPHGTVHACAMCLERYPDDWQTRLLAAGGGTAARQPSSGRRDPYGRNWSLD